MGPEAIWTVRAEADLIREFARSEEVREGGGAELVETVDAALRLLRINPTMAPMYASAYRRLVLRNRRLGIFYCVEARGIIIHAVCDLRQDRSTILRHLSS